MKRSLIVAYLANEMRVKRSLVIFASFSSRAMRFRRPAVDRRCKKLRDETRETLTPDKSIFIRFYPIAGRKSIRPDFSRRRRNKWSALPLFFPRTRRYSDTLALSPIAAIGNRRRLFLSLPVPRSRCIRLQNVRARVKRRRVCTRADGNILREERSREGILLSAGDSPACSDHFERYIVTETWLITVLADA